MVHLLPYFLAVNVRKGLARLAPTPLTEEPTIIMRDFIDFVNALIKHEARASL
jgi:hypothetical protein